MKPEEKPENPSPAKVVIPLAMWVGAMAVYTILQPGLSPVRLFSKSMAATATILLAVSIGMAGFARVFPVANRALEHRKFWGLAGFGFALLHAILAFHDPLLRSVELALSRPNVRIGLMALSVFAILAVTSNRFSQRALGKHWKTLQRAGYIGLFLVWADLLVLADGSFVRTTIGLLLFGIVSAGLVFGIWGWFFTRENSV